MRARPLHIALAVCALGCKPDLVPIHSPGQPENPNGFCTQSGESPAVIFTVNQGTGSAGAAVAKVDFGQQVGMKALPIPPLGPGDTAQLGPVVIPLGCFSSDCPFSITVDSANVVAESNEQNNSTPGLCIG